MLDSLLISGRAGAVCVAGHHFMASNKLPFYNYMAVVHDSTSVSTRTTGTATARNGGKEEGQGGGGGGGEEEEEEGEEEIDDGAAKGAVLLPPSGHRPRFLTNNSYTLIQQQRRWQQCVSLTGAPPPIPNMLSLDNINPHRSHAGQAPASPASPPGTSLASHTTPARPLVVPHVWAPAAARPQDPSSSSAAAAFPASALSDEAASLAAGVWPPRSYHCTFCRREFRSAQALGGHMNVHRRDRARLRQSSPPANTSSITTSEADVLPTVPSPAPAAPPSLVSSDLFPSAKSPMPHIVSRYPINPSTPSNPHSSSNVHIQFSQIHDAASINITNKDWLQRRAPGYTGTSNLPESSSSAPSLETSLSFDNHRARLLRSARSTRDPSNAPQMARSHSSPRLAKKPFKWVVHHPKGQDGAESMEIRGANAMMQGSLDLELRLGHHIVE